MKDKIEFKQMNSMNAGDMKVFSTTESLEEVKKTFFELVDKGIENKKKSDEEEKPEIKNSTYTG